MMVANNFFNIILITNFPIHFTIPFILKFCLSNADVTRQSIYSLLASQVAICMIFVNRDLQTTPFLLEIFVYIFESQASSQSQLYQLLIFYIIHCSIVSSLSTFLQVATSSQLTSQLHSYNLSLLSDLCVTKCKQKRPSRKKCKG